MIFREVSTNYVWASPKINRSGGDRWRRAWRPDSNDPANAIRDDLVDSCGQTADEKVSVGIGRGYGQGLGVTANNHRDSVSGRARGIRDVPLEYFPGRPKRRRPRERERFD